MDSSIALEIVNKIFINIFNIGNSLNLDDLLDKYAFDIKLPKMVNDSITNEVTWADSVNSGKYITNKNMEMKDNSTGWMLKKKNINGLNDILKIWDSINFITTERVYDSINVSCSDTIYRCENIYRCSDCSDSKNLVYCDSCGNSEFLLASQRSYTCSFCIRCDDSKDCSNCYNIICSNKISNSFFIQDCYDLYECMFCSHISSKKYCIANMQFEKEEYYQIKSLIIEWIIKSN